MGNIVNGEAVVKMSLSKFKKLQDTLNEGWFEVKFSFGEIKKQLVKSHPIDHFQKNEIVIIFSNLDKDFYDIMNKMFLEGNGVGIISRDDGIYHLNGLKVKMAKIIELEIG